MWYIQTILLLFAVLSCSYALPSFQCARYCKEESGSFGYTSGKFYTYKYSGTAKSLVNTTSNNVVDQSGVNIDCIVTFQSLSNCDYVMEMSEVTITDYHVKSTRKSISKSEKFASLENQLQANPLFFAFNGKIDTICPDSSELKEIIDIKRGILSVFQNSNPLFKENALVYETDITGNCETHYRVYLNENGEKLVNKTKNLAACDHRMSNYFSWQTVPYMSSSAAKSMPLLKSTFNCHQKYGDHNTGNNAILLKSECSEKHVFQPFSNEDNGAMTTITQSLQLVSVVSSAKIPQIPKDMKRGTLIFEYNADKMATNDPTLALSILNDLEMKTKDGVDMDVPGIFSQLVSEFQRLSKTALLDIYNQINAKQRVFYIDAISLITSNSGIEVMSNLYENRKIDDKQMNTWLMSMNFIKHPNKQTVKLIHPMLTKSKIKQSAMLSLSSILYKYCSKENCLDDMVIMDIMKSIESPINNNCVISSEQDEADIFLTLKSIGNAGLTTSYYNLQNCYLNNELPIELRLAAIAAHRRMKCAENENLDDFKRLFSNSRANSELRIASYLASMQCASYATFAQVKDVLLSEEANQVGSFIWTHLTNLQETSIPWKQGIKKLLENEFLQNKFNTDLRKYSRNYEASTFFDSIGTGGGVEANLIFSSESYLPRAAMLNFTVDLFGETINVLELGTRVEGFEDIVESLLNRDGSDENKNQENQIEKQERIDEFGEMLKVLPKQPSGSGYIKVFGNEITFADFTNLKDLFGKPISGKAALDMLMQFVKAPEIEYVKSFSILDSNYKVPTILGFPLQLKANATATLGLTAGGEINVQDIRNHKMLVNGRFYPSVSVQVACTMAMDTYLGVTGVQFLGALKSNMYIDGYMNLEMGRVVDVKINVPKKQMDIFTVTSDVYIVHNEETFLIQDASNNVENAEFCSDPYISRLIGLQFCNQWRFVNSSSIAGPSFPLTGSFKYSMHIKKTDTFDFYKLYVETRLTAPNQQYLIDFLLDTPNSKVDRKLQCTLSVDLQDYKVNIQIHSPFARFQFYSNIERKLPNYTFQLVTKYNDNEVASLLSTFDINDEGEIRVYKPLAKINYKQQQLVTLSGNLRSSLKTGEYTADLKLQGLTNEVAQVYGSFASTHDSFSIRTTIAATHFKGTFQGDLNARANEVHADAILNYTYNSDIYQKIRFQGELTKSISEVLKKNHIFLKFEASEWPKYDTHIEWMNQRGFLYFNNTAEVTFFETTWRTHQILKLDKGFSDPEPDMLLLADLQSPQNDIDYQGKLQFLMKKKHFKSHALLKVSSVQRSEALIEYVSKPAEDTFNVLLYYSKKKWAIDGLLTKEQNKNYNFDVNCRYAAYEVEHLILTLKGDYKNTSLGEVQNHKVNCTLDLPETNSQWGTPWLITSSIQKSHTTLLSISKVMTKESIYAGYFNLIEDSLAMSLQANDKQLFVLNGAATDEFVNLAVALNIHQHFELTAKLMLPYEKFDLVVYWDKDQDEGQRFLFSYGQNEYKGLYNIDIEYPNQRISTNILFVQTQVVMNVTWGIEVSQRIYLKVGNKHYDDGGIWFGELETPFRYLEKQQFNLQYAVVSDSFDVQSDLSWRSHQINLLMAGSKSDTQIRGTLQLNTTLPEIRKVGATLSHTNNMGLFGYRVGYQSDVPDFQAEFRSNAALEYNDHSIEGVSQWIVKGDHVDSFFRVQSATDTIDPIFGYFKLNDDLKDDVVSDMKFALNWQKKNITAMYNFKKDTSSIQIITPFEGIEKTVLKYSVVTEADTVYLSTTVDLFKNNNSITLSWSNTEDTTTCWLDVMSPMTGRYYIYFTHSVLLGKLMENFKIQGPENKDLLQMKIEGDIMPFLDMNVTASILLLDNNATLTITNSKNPLLSKIMAKWNGRTINSKVRLQFDESQLVLLNWLLESNLFAPVNISYEKNNQECITKIILPNDYNLINTYNHLNPYWQNTFEFKLPQLDITFVHKAHKDLINQKLIAQLQDKRIDYTLQGTKTIGTTNQLNLFASYNYLEVNNLIYSYNLTSNITQGNEQEEAMVQIRSTSTLNGNLLFERHISSELRKSSMTFNCDFPTFCNLVAEMNSKHLLWNNKKLNKHVKVLYNIDGNSLTTNLTSTYEDIPNADLHFQYKDTNIGLKLNIQDYYLSIQSDNNVRLASFILKKQKKTVGTIILEFDGARKFNSIWEVNTNEKFNGTFNYDISPKYFEIKFGVDSVYGKAQYQSVFWNEAHGPIVGLIVGRYNKDVYSTSIKYTSKQLDLALKTPKDEYTGKIHHQNIHLMDVMCMELSSRTSKNYFNITRKINNYELFVASDYLKLPMQEVRFLSVQNTFGGIGGEGYYINGDSDKHLFNISFQLFENWSLAFHRPDGVALLKANGYLRSLEDFNTTVEGTWNGRKYRMDLKNYFGSYYQTTFNLITPIEGWGRTSLDCTLNEQKIGIAFQAKGHYMSIIAGRTGNDMLSIEYMGETLLEMSSSEGHLTLRTTSYLGRYRLFVQVTQTPGIYVFSILRDGDNIVSLMLQNYSANEILHYKGKLMAPEIIPSNSTLSVEFKGQVDVWKMFDFKLKKDHKPLFELGWENNKQRNGVDGSFKFQSQIDPNLNFKIRPSYSINDDNDLDVDVELRYPCQKHTECSFTFVLTPNRMICNSLSSVDVLNFHSQSNFNYGTTFMDCDFEFNDFKHTNIAINISSKVSSHLFINGMANFKGQSAVATLNFLPNKLQMEVARTHNDIKYYISVKSQTFEDHFEIDLHLPDKIAIKGHLSQKNGWVTIKKDQEKYEGRWSTSTTGPRLDIGFSLKENDKQVGNIGFTNTFIKGPTFKSSTMLNINFYEHKIETTLTGSLGDSNDVHLRIQSSLEYIKSLEAGISFKQSSDQVDFENILKTANKEFKLSANGLTTNKGMVVKMVCKPWGQAEVVNQTITANLRYDVNEHNYKEASYNFKIDLGDGSSYYVRAQPSKATANNQDVYLVEVRNEQDKELIHMTFNKNAINVQVMSIGVIDQFSLKYDEEGFLLASHTLHYQYLMFMKTGAFGLVLNNKNNKTECFRIIYKFNGTLPRTYIPIANYYIHTKHGVFIDGAFLDYGFSFVVSENKPKKTWSSRIDLHIGHDMNMLITLDEFEHIYRFQTQTDTELTSLMVSKNLQHVKNEFYIPFETHLNWEQDVYKFSLITPNCTVSLSKEEQYIDIILGDNDFKFKFYLEDGSLLVYYEKDNQLLHFEVNPQKSLRFILNNAELLDLSYNVNGFIVKFKHMVNDQEISCDLLAKSVYDVQFELLTDKERTVLWKNYIDESSIAYEFVAPKWNLLKLFDIDISWENSSSGRVFEVALKLDSDYTGPTEVGTVFEKRKFLLNIESYFKTPFLKGLESFNGKIYIPEKFKPHLVFVLPGRTYKFIVNHGFGYMETEIVCLNDQFMMLINTASLENVTIHIKFPDERFRSFLFKFSKIASINLELGNGNYSIHVNPDLSYVDVRTPYQSYEHFGYLCTQSFRNNHGEFKLVIVHPEYIAPLGLAFQVDYKNDEVDFLYSVHSPFAIQGYDFVTINMSTLLLPEGFEGKINFITNDIDIGGGFAFVLSEDENFIQVNTHYNNNYYIGLLNIQPKKIYIILGNSTKEEYLFLESFPDFDRHVSPTVYMFYAGIEDKNMDLLIHFGTQPFSLRISGDHFVKLIWDLRHANKTALGVKLLPGQVEMYLADNQLTAKQHTNKTSNVLNVIWNDLNLEYASYYTNVSIADDVYYVTSIRRLQTPLGQVHLTQHSTTAATKLSNQVVIEWANARDSQPSKLVFNNEITPGTLTSSVVSTMLSHPLTLKVDMSAFRSIPSNLHGTFTYSDQPDKTIEFSMRYNKIIRDPKDGVITNRVFIVKHPTSKVDYEVYFNAVRMEEFSNGSVSLRYRNFDTNQIETILGSVKVYHSKFGVHTEVATRRNRFNLVATSTTGVKRHGFLVHIEINDKDPLNLECAYNFQKETPSVSLMAAYGTSRKYVFYAGMPSEKEITAKLGHEIYGHASLDALAIIKLNTSQLLWMKFLWKDNLYAPFHEAILDEYNDLRYVIGAMGKELIDVIHDDIGKELITDYVNIKNRCINQTMTDLQTSIKLLQRRDVCQNSLKKLCRLLSGNEFKGFIDFLKQNLTFFYDVLDYVVNSTFTSLRILFDAVNIEIQLATKNIKNIQNIKIDAKTILKRGINSARQSLRDMEKVVVKLLDDFDHYVGDVEYQIEEFFDPFLTLVDDFIAYIEQRLMLLQIAVLDTIDSIQQYIVNLREIKSMCSVYHSYINWLEELHFITMLDPVADVVEEILETIISDVKRLLDHYKPYLDALGDALFGKYDGLQQLPAVVEVREHANRIYHKTIWIWHYNNMTQALKNGVKKLTSDVDHALSFMDDVDAPYETTDVQFPFWKNYVFKPENRLIEISQPLPMEWEAFNKSPSFANYPLYQKIQGKSQQFIKFYKSRYDLIDMLQNFVVDMYEPSMAPITMNRAMIIGQTQYTTFNGLTYSFLSNCSYLLASDFRTKSFSLIVNYRNTTGTIMKSYEILSDNNSIEFFSESNITIDGQKVELPIIQKKLIITREKKNIIAESSKGFKLTCYFHYNYCTVQLSGWLFGKTAGLLGTLDNEKYTDIMTAEKTHTGMTNFLKSWQLEKEEHCNLIQPPDYHSYHSADYVSMLCMLWFNNTGSPLQKCFHEIDPQPYFEMCNNEMMASPYVNPCEPAAAYVHQCKQSRITIDMPMICVTCKYDIGYNEEIFDGHNNKTVDVVFITEMDCFNISSVTRILPKQLDRELMMKQFVGNRFATVGYGGGVFPKPHVHTHDGDIWSTSERVYIQSRLNGTKSKTKHKFTGIDAIKYAANLENRVGVPKLFILLQCEIATDIGNSPDIYNMLGEKDITLHVLKPTPFVDVESQVFGIDVNNAITSSLNTHIAANQIINQIDDMYSGLALSTNGTIFNLRMVRTNSSAVRWAHALAERVQASPCQKCKCVVDSSGVGKIECSRCLAPAVRQFLNEYEESHKMKFNDNDDSQ